MTTATTAKAATTVDLDEALELDLGADGILLVHGGSNGRSDGGPIVVADGTHRWVVEVVRATADEAESSTTIEVAPGGRLDHLVVLDGATDAGATVRTRIAIHDHAEVRSGTLSLGSGTVRRELDASLVGAGATVNLGGLVVPQPGARHEVLATVRHEASHGTSRQQFAAIVPDHARAAFTGEVVVAAGTVGTDADQQSRNLLLGPSARADALPWLEIHSDDVACTHGATVGHLDEEGLFYLRSRGIPGDDARTMLLDAFAAAATEQLAVPGAVADWVGGLARAAVASLVALRRGAAGTDREGSDGR